MIYKDDCVAPKRILPIYVDDSTGTIYVLKSGDIIVSTVLENRTSDPPKLAIGQMWVRTDL